MHRARAIANTPNATWAEQIQKIPDVCPSPQECGQPHSCRVRNAAYLRVQWRMHGKRENAKAART